MPRAIELLREGKNEELWQMCCGFLRLNVDEFMDVQKRLLLEQLQLLNRSPLGKKIMRGAKPETVAGFRQRVPLTTYADYCPELLEKREDVLPAKPDSWVRSSGRSGEYPCRWVPMTPACARELSVLIYGVGMLSCCKRWNDVSQIPECPRVVYTVAPRPYITGELYNLMEQQSPVVQLPALEEAEKLSFEDRVRLGFKQALSQGVDYFFGMSLVLAEVGEKLNQSSGRMKISPLLSQPKALLRLAKGLAKSKLARRPMIPKDLWSVKGIMCGGLDSWVYREKIKELWGRYPLDVYVTTEGGFIATQLWDYQDMTFIPNLNFLEFIPEVEHYRSQMDRSYQPKTVLLDEVEPGENYELVITNFHGGAMVRYRIGDMIKITSLRNEKLGIDIPQMVFERRVDGLINFVVIQLTEKLIWQAIEKTGIAYVDWVAYKLQGESVLRLLIEPKGDLRGGEADIAAAIKKQIVGSDSDLAPAVLDDLTDMIDFSIEVVLLPRGSFAHYIAKRQAEGADLAHLKPPHLNPSDEVLSLLLSKSEEIKATAEAEKIAV
jgi:hypothetical protein